MLSNLSAQRALNLRHAADLVRPVSRVGKGAGGNALTLSWPRPNKHEPEAQVLMLRKAIAPSPACPAGAQV